MVGNKVGFKDLSGSLKVLVVWGGGTTGVACRRLDRSFLGFEKDPEYFKIAVERVNNELAQKKINGFLGDGCKK